MKILKNNRRKNRIIKELRERLHSDFFYNRSIRRQNETLRIALNSTYKTFDEYKKAISEYDDLKEKYSILKASIKINEG